jgi:hypothetical protein
MSQKQYWLIGQSSEGMERLHELEDRIPPAVIVKYDREASHRESQDRWDRRIANIAGVLGPKDPAQWVPMTLTILEESFCPEFFVRSAWFVSARLREVMDLPDHVAQYLPVDSSGCHEKAREQNYMVMDPFAVQNAIDTERSVIDYGDYPEDDGTITKQVLGVKNFVWRECFVSEVPIFRDPHDNRFFATDAFAEKVLRAGITDMKFQDVTSERAKKELVIKTL